jgi:hypothetical protein
MIGFLKKDVAELLSNGHDKHAFGRVSFPLFFLSLAMPSISLKLHCSAGTNDSGLMLSWRKMRRLCSSFSAATLAKVL